MQREYQTAPADENVAAAAVELGDDEVAEIDRRFAAIEVQGERYAGALAAGIMR